MSPFSISSKNLVSRAWDRSPPDLKRPSGNNTKRRSGGGGGGGAGGAGGGGGGRVKVIEREVGLNKAITRERAVSPQLTPATPVTPVAEDNIADISIHSGMMMMM